MSNELENKNNWATQMGLITGPIIIICGIAVLIKSDKPFFGGLFIVVGLFRLGSALWLKHKANQRHSNDENTTDLK